MPIDDSDTDDDTEATSEPSAAVPKKRRISECITLDSDSDDNEQEEVRKLAKLLCNRPVFTSILSPFFLLFPLLATSLSIGPL